MNNSIGSFDNFAYYDNPTDIETSGGEISSGDEDVPSPKKPAVKKTILCDQDFVPMTKNLENLEKTAPGTEESISDASKTTPSPAKRKKARITKHTPEESSGKNPIKNQDPGQAQAPRKNRRRAKTSKEVLGADSLTPANAESTPEKVLEADSLSPPKAGPKNRIRVGKRVTGGKKGRAKKKDLSEDIKAQLKELFSNLSKIYFSFD